MIISLILRLIFLYFLWNLGRRLWVSYFQAKKPVGQPGRAESKRPSKEDGIFEAEFRVIKEQE